MLKHICPGLILLLVLAAPAWAETPSQNCLSAIKAADARHRADKVPADCWRMGPLHLGMRLDQLRTLLGNPDASQTLNLTYRRRKYPVTQLLYVYPRNLKNWLKLAPARMGDFHPVSVRLSFSGDALVAMTVRNAVRMTYETCKPSTPGPRFVHKGVDFPYGFHGLTLGASLADVQARFGRFAAKQAANYWPVPLAVSGNPNVEAIDIAQGMAFAGRSSAPDFRLKLDPGSCFVTGYTLAPGP
jgi:hypothetical protein